MDFFLKTNKKKLIEQFQSYETFFFKSNAFKMLQYLHIQDNRFGYLNLINCNIR